MDMMVNENTTYIGSKWAENLSVLLVVKVNLIKILANTDIEKYGV
jgi:hypothetical protein